MSWLPRKRVVVPYDFSEESLAAVELGRQFVESPELLHVVHVLPELTATEPGVIWSTIWAVEKTFKKRCWAVTIGCAWIAVSAASPHPHPLSPS
jgi:hypothetical protein